MDYANGEELWKYQWDLIHDPETILLGFMQNEEEGAFTISIHNDILIGAMHEVNPDAKFDNTYFALLLSVGVLADGGTIICETKEYTLLARICNPCNKRAVNIIKCYHKIVVALVV